MLAEQAHIMQHESPLANEQINRDLTNAEQLYLLTHIYKTEKSWEAFNKSFQLHEDIRRNTFTLLWNAEYASGFWGIPPLDLNGNPIKSAIELERLKSKYDVNVVCPHIAVQYEITEIF